MSEELQNARRLLETGETEKKDWLGMCEQFGNAGGERVCV
jgi:hypothetical protein